MFRIQRKRASWIALGLVLGLLLLPLPATAGSFWEGAGAQGWEGIWAGLLDWLGLGPAAVEASSIYIDPDGQPKVTPPGTAGSESSSYIDPNGQP